MGYAALPVFFLLYAKRCSDSSRGSPRSWLAAFALGAGAAMIAAGFIRTRAC